ncbi:hypothetical protein [Enterococcus sp. DIV0240a]|uniref:hypothetical protein n=1 Tax=Enterococcus sp. DIV0240a TaxID=2774651 RepID=UPI003D2E0AD6
MSGFEDLGLTPAQFMNRVHSMLPPYMKSAVPVAEAGQTDFTGIGKALEANAQFASTWHQTAINLVSKIQFDENKIVNPMAEFEGELITTGDKIEEMIIDAAETFAFNPSKAEKKLFERRKPDLKAIIHTATRDVSNVRTLQDTVYTTIFRSVAELDSYVVKVTQSLISGNEYEKYYTTKELISKAVSKGSIRTIDLGSNVGAKEIQQAISQVTKLMVHPNRYFNMGNIGQPDARGKTGINIQADFSQLRLLLPVSTSVTLNTDFFANVFHLDAVKTGLAIKEVDFFPNLYEYTAEHTVTAEDVANGYVDNFNFELGDKIPAGSTATEGAYTAAQAEDGLNDVTLKFDASRIQAVILDKRALVINPMLPLTLASEANPLGRYTQIVLQDKEMFSYSPFMPACVILADDPIDVVDYVKITAMPDVKIASGQVDAKITSGQVDAKVTNAAEIGTAVADAINPGTLKAEINQEQEQAQEPDLEQEPEPAQEEKAKKTKKK